MSTLKVGGIRGVSASSDAITIANDGTCTANVTSVGGGSLGNRNMLINGAMQVNQRANGSLTINSSTGQFPCDRWVARGEGGSKEYTIQQVSIASSGQGVRNAIKVTSSQAATVGSSDIFNVRQMVEGYNIQRINFGESGCKSMTLSFTVRSSVAGTHSGAIQNSAQNRSYPFTYTLSANTWTDISVTIPPITDGSSWNETNGVGVRVVFDMGSGNNFRGTAGQWNSAQNEGATDAVRILETNGATWEVTKVQLQVGSVGTDYEHRSFAEELTLCHRYYVQRGFDSLMGSTAGQIGFPRVLYPVTMRTAASTFIQYDNTNGAVRNQNDGSKVTGLNTYNHYDYGFASRGGGSTGTIYASTYYADAEL